MAYDKQIYAQILREYDSIQNEHIKELERKKEEVYRKIPRIREIDEELSSTGLELTVKFSIKLLIQKIPSRQSNRKIMI